MIHEPMTIGGTVYNDIRVSKIEKQILEIEDKISDIEDYLIYLNEKIIELKKLLQ